jgi:hypothetical protein
MLSVASFASYGNLHLPSGLGEEDVKESSFAMGKRIQKSASGNERSLPILGALLLRRQELDAQLLLR